MKSSREYSKFLDDRKVDIVDLDNQMSCYIQCKNTQSSPNIEKIIKECPLKEKPLVIFWKKSSASSKEHEYVLMPKKYFYNLLKPECEMLNKN